MPTSVGVNPTSLTNMSEDNYPAGTPPQTPPQPTETVEVEANKIVSLDKIVNLDELKENSVIALRFPEPTPLVIKIVSMFGQRYGDQLRKKNISVILIGPDDNIETLDEVKMEQLGWVRKQEKSRLILPA